jgi:hypothetical protein
VGCAARFARLAPVRDQRQINPFGEGSVPRSQSHTVRDIELGRSRPFSGASTSAIADSTKGNESFGRRVQDEASQAHAAIRLVLNLNSVSAGRSNSPAGHKLPVLLLRALLKDRLRRDQTSIAYGQRLARRSQIQIGGTSSWRIIFTDRESGDRAVHAHRESCRRQRPA